MNPRLSEFLGNSQVTAFLQPTIRTVLEQGNTDILKNVANTFEHGVGTNCTFLAVEQKLTMEISIIPGDSWDDARRFFASVFPDSRRPYLTWTSRELNSHRNSMWLAHWVFLIRPFHQSDPCAFRCLVALSIAGRNQKQVELLVNSDSLLNPEEVMALSQGSKRWWQMGLFAKLFGRA